MCSISLGEALSGYVVFVEQSSVQSVVNRAALAEYGPGMTHLYILQPGCLSRNINIVWSSQHQVAFLVPVVIVGTLESSSFGEHD